MILREIKDLEGISVGGKNIKYFRYADDTVLISTTEGNLQQILDKVVQESVQTGLTINCKKTECMVISKKERPPPCKLTLGTKVIKQVNGFNYLGSWFTSD